MRVSGGAGTGFGKDTADFSIGQGYFNDRLRVYYMLGQSKLDGVFWISVPDGASGAHLNWEGQEDDFSRLLQSDGVGSGRELGNHCPGGLRVTLAFTPPPARYCSGQRGETCGNSWSCWTTAANA